MQHLKQKIKETTLFSDEDKIAILAAMDSYEVSDRNALEKIIDEFDQTYRQSVAEYKKAVGTTLDTILRRQNLLAHSVCSPPHHKSNQESICFLPHRIFSSVYCLSCWNFV